MTFTDKTAIVTGANAGIGHECARELLSRGAAVAGVDIRAEGMESLRETAAQHGTRFWAYSCDVRDAAAVRNTVQDFLHRTGKLDIVLNIAGVTMDLPLSRIDEAAYRRVMDINVGGTFNFCQAAAAQMKKQRSGAIVCTSSVTADYGTQMGCIYGASKAGVLGLTKSLALELAAWNIRVNAVAPGVVDTEMVAHLSPVEKQTCARSVPLGRLAEPEEVAKPILFLASPEASYITGATLYVDGGYRPVYVPVNEK
jgi:3-oxoacyl-[acyl-carrier protein] reductase